MIKFKKNVTLGEKYTPAMKISDPKKAQEYFEACVRHTMTFGKTRQDAEQIEKINLGYYAGYYDTETRIRVEKLFACSHPIFGSVLEKGIPTPEQAFKEGKKMASK